MCYAIPGKIVALKGNIGVVDYFGEHRNVLVDMSDIRIGDYVYAQGGVLISVIAEDDALKILNGWEKAFFQLKEIDRKISGQGINDVSADTRAFSIIQEYNQRKKLSREQFIELLSLSEQKDLELLYSFSNNLRQKENDNACCVHGIIEFSNHCLNNCTYCGIRKDAKIKRYRLTKDEIISAADHAIKELGFKAIVLQSGEDMSYSDDIICEIVSEIRSRGVLVFLSIGMRPRDSYRRFYDAGARAVLMRFEHSDKELFVKYRPGALFEERIDLIRYLKSLGYIVATGFIIGLPEETDEQILDNILLTKELGADMYSIGPFIPASDTPLKNHNSPSLDTVLKIIAISRLVDPKSKILVTTALETLDGKGKRLGLLAGANSLMLNLTPARYKRLYSIYDGRANSKKDINKEIKETIDLLYSLGRAPTDLGL